MLSITNTPTQLHVTRTPSNMQYTIKKPKLNFTQDLIKPTIKTVMAQVEIDQYPCRKTSGLMNTADLSRDNVQYSKQQAFKHISENIAEGHMLSNIPLMGGGRALSQIGKQAVNREKQFGMVTMPSERPIIRLKEGSGVNIDWDSIKNPVHVGYEGNPTTGEVNYSYTPAKLNINVKQYGSIKIKYIGENVDARL